jgi:hypothetical protein
MSTPLANPHSRRAMLRCATILLCVSLGPEDLPLGLGPRLGFAQVDTTRIPSAVMLKRLGEVVDGHRGGVPVYVVASYDFPHAVAGVVESRAEADALVRAAGNRFDRFGPFLSRKDPGRLVYFLMKCVHDQITSAMHPEICPSGPFFAFSDVDTVKVTVWLKTHGVQTFTVPARTDAMFFTMAAIDKFAIPYYTRVLGVEEAARMRQQIVGGLPRR